MGSTKQPWGRRPPSEGRVFKPLQHWGDEDLCPTSVDPQVPSWWPPAAVPGLGCPSLEESYPSLANQPSSRAMQGDVRLSSVSWIAYAPMASMPSTCLGIPSPAGGSLALIIHLGEPRFLLQGESSLCHLARDRSMAPATTRLQPQHKMKTQAIAVGNWIVTRGSFLVKRTRRANIECLRPFPRGLPHSGRD